jgi:hypothetical protein
MGSLDVAEDGAAVADEREGDAAATGSAVGGVTVHSLSKRAPLDANSSGPDVIVTGPAKKHAASSLHVWQHSCQSQETHNMGLGRSFGRAGGYSQGLHH